MKLQFCLFNTVLATHGYAWQAIIFRSFFSFQTPPWMSQLTFASCSQVTKNWKWISKIWGFLLKIWGPKCLFLGSLSTSWLHRKWLWNETHYRERKNFFNYWMVTCMLPNSGELDSQMAEITLCFFTHPLVALQISGCYHGCHAGKSVCSRHVHREPVGNSVYAQGSRQIATAVHWYMSSL